jgi:hypothetical protein
LGDTLEYAVGIRERLVAPEPKHAVAETFEDRSATSVVGGAYRVLTAVELHDQLHLPTAEVNDVRTNRHLTCELRSKETPIAQSRPQPALGVGLSPP